MKSNFAFLRDSFPVLANFGELAEKYLYSDSNSCLLKLGMIGETIINLIFTYDRISLPDPNTAVNRIDALYREGMISRDLADILHALRKIRNKAVHENYASIEEGKSLIQMAYSLSEWFMQTYGDWNYQSESFVMPPETDDVIIVDKENEEVEEERMIVAASEIASVAPAIDKEERKKQARKVARQRVRTEAETRYLIDEQLRKVGWEADTKTLRYSKGTRPSKGRNIAIAEWPTESTVGDKGYADYALFVGTQLVGIIEAKAIHKDIPSVIDYQCKDYSRNIRFEDEEYQLGTWRNYKVPFIFATNGRSYLEQYDTKSGVWFLDLREPDNVPRALKGWMSPIGMLELLEKDIVTKNQALQDMPYDILRDKDGLNLREYQLKAIQASEKAIIKGQKNILLAMATGTGKTRTILGMIYRFLKTGRFRRILFLVDRTSLGEQATDVFKEVKLEDLMTLDNIYNIKGMEDKKIECETRVQVATVQSMVKRILYNGEESMPAVTDFDLIIIDEAHRGYILDKEMGEDELLYRDQIDYQSKYRSVVEYFDAVKIALTATPALQTTEIFGQPVYKYTYREAVIEGYYIDQDDGWSVLYGSFQNQDQYRKNDRIKSLYYHLNLYTKSTVELMAKRDRLQDEISVLKNDAARLSDITEAITEEMQGIVPADDTEQFDRNIQMSKEKIKVLVNKIGEKRNRIQELEVSLEQHEHQMQVITEYHAITGSVDNSKELEIHSCPRCGYLYDDEIYHRVHANYLNVSDTYVKAYISQVIVSIQDSLGEEKQQYVALMKKLKDLETAFSEKEEGFNLYIRQRGMSESLDKFNVQLQENQTKQSNIQEILKSIRKELKKLPNKKEVEDKYIEFTRSNIIRLGAWNAAYDGTIKLLSPIKAQGTLENKIILAQFVGLFQTMNYFKTQIIRFPFVVDSPRGKEASQESSKEILSMITDINMLPQVILATIDFDDYKDTLGDSAKKANIITLYHQNSLLIDKDYQKYEKEISELVELFKACI